MKRKCECGHEFEVESDAAAAKCPECGRLLDGPAEQDWLDAVELDDLSVEGDSNQETDEAAEAAADLAEQTPSGEPRLELQSDEKSETEAEQESGGRGLELQTADTESEPRRPVPPTQRRPAAAPRADEATSPPLRHLPDALRVLKGKPEDALPYVRDGVEAQTFIVETAAAFVGLALIAGFALGHLRTSEGLGIAAGFAQWLTILVEYAVSAVVLTLLCILLKREAKPLGVAEGLAVVRIGGLAIVILAAIVLGVPVTVLGGNVPGAIAWPARNLTKLYAVVVFAPQAALVMGLLKLGCLPGLAVSAVLSYGGYAMAEKLLGVF